MRVSAVVVSHGHARELERSLPALAPQVDELVVVANLPGSVGSSTFGARVVENTRPVSFAANVNRGVALTSGELVVISNPDAYPEPGAVAELARFAAEHPRAGLVGPLVLWPDGTWQPSLRRFPTVLGTIWRRTPLRLLRDPYRHQVSHYGTRARPSRCRATGCWAAPACCCGARCSTSSAAGTQASATTSRTSTSPTAPRRRAGSAGSSRPRRPPRLRRGVDKRFLDRHTLWHARGMARFLRKHPERLLALR